MILLLTLLTLASLSLAGFCVWFIHRDREHYRKLYFELVADSRKREAHLFDETLRAKGIRPTSVIDKPLPEAPPKFISQTEMDVNQDMLRELVEIGRLSDAEAQVIASDFRNGRLTQSQLDNILWTAQAQGLAGSTSSIF